MALRIQPLFQGQCKGLFHFRHRFESFVDISPVICFSFSWIPVFIIWKLISIHRRRNRSLDQEIEAGNMPFQTNPSKPTRGSWRPPRPDPHSIEMTKFPQEPLSTVSRSDSLQKEYHGKRRPMPTQTTDPRIRKLPDIDDAAIEEQANKVGGLWRARLQSSLTEEHAQPRQAFNRHASPPLDRRPAESFGAPGPSSRVPHNYPRFARSHPRPRQKSSQRRMRDSSPGSDLFVNGGP